MLVQQRPEIRFNEDRVLGLDVDETRSRLRQLLCRREALLPAAALPATTEAADAADTATSCASDSSRASGARLRQRQTGSEAAAAAASASRAEGIRSGIELVVSESAPRQSVGQDLFEKRLLAVEVRRRRTRLSSARRRRR